MRISDWSSDVCSSDLDHVEARHQVRTAVADVQAHVLAGVGGERVVAGERPFAAVEQHVGRVLVHALLHVEPLVALLAELARGVEVRSEEHTSELQALMRISYAVFCLKKKKTKHT